MSLLTDKNYNNVCRQKFDYIIVDEAHHSLADTYRKLFQLFPEAKKLGVTATPWRLNHESFLSLYQCLITSPQISWFISNGLLADFDYVSIRPDSEVQRLVDNSIISSTGDFSNTDLDNTFNNQRIRSKLYESYLQFASGRKGIIYAINKRHAAKISELYSAHGIKAVAIDCDTSKEKRQHLISAFKKGDIKVLVNVDIFTEGFDCPDVNFIQLARPTKSLALYLQQVGRGLRITEGKEKTIILDNVGLYNYFGLPDANRKWQHHFKGRDDVEHEPHGTHERGGSEMSDFDFDESRFNEEDGQMLVVRGALSAKPGTNGGATMPVKVQTVVKEIFLCNYYLVIGNKKMFKMYPFIKKRGKATDGVGNCVLEYDEDKNKVVFTDDVQNNRQKLNDNIKLQSVVAFAAMLAGICIDDVLDIKRLQELSGYEKRNTANVFEVLEMISAVYRINRVC